MNEETLDDATLMDGALGPGDRFLVQGAPDVQGTSPGSQGRELVAVAATFTADLLLQPLRFWLETLRIPADVTLASYAQVMQELLDPGSLFSQNRSGFNVLLIRLEDWIRDRLAESFQSNIEHVGRAGNEFAEAIGVMRARTGAATFVFFCPPSTSLPTAYRQPFEDIERGLLTRLATVPGMHCWTHTDLQRLYPVAAHEDARADRIGHIPYTSEYFAAIATLLARRMAVLRKPQYKVIAIDCDNTLWKGVCGEDGPTGVELTPTHLQLQRMLVRQHDAGMLLCLCSKNNVGDVEAVFRAHPEMPLRDEHVLCWRVNWSSKSSNLESLAEELDLSLDSFILIDDSAMECAEVKTHCPAVLTLQFPQSDEEISHFLDHVWAFDRIGVTEDGKRRTAQYKQNRARNKALEEAADFEKFLASLDLAVRVEQMEPLHLPRVAELVRRTNQFNLTTIRRSASEIEMLWKSGEMQILVIHVRDRFGDYGLVGAVFFRTGTSSIEVDTFVLSCRVLGRGVEHRIINELGQIARDAGLARIVLRYRQTARNAPAWTFLEKSFGEFQAASTRNGDSSAEAVFAIATEYAQSLRVESAVGKVADSKSGSTLLPGAPETISTQWHEAAYRLSRVADIVQEISRFPRRERRGSVEHVAPRTPTESAVAQIWAEVLGLEEIGIRDDFFDLGGDSLMAVQAISRIGSVLGSELPLHEFFEGATVEQVVRKLGRAAQSGAAIERLNQSGPALLSSGQQRLWFIDQLEGGSAAYHIPFAVRLHGELDRAALQAALDMLIERHEVLRTVFVKIDGKPVQQIVPNARFSLQQFDVRVREAQEREAEVSSHSREELAARFDLGSGPLIRGRLLRLSEDEHVLLITMHHIVSDGWSIGVFLRELGALYGACRDRRTDPLLALPIQYSDYAHWQQRRLAQAELQGQLRYWQQHLQGAPESLELPTDRPRPAVQSYRGSSVCVALGRELTAELKAVSRRHNVTLAMTLYTAWSIVLSRLSGQADVVVGMPVANRRRAELEGLIGFFVNTLAVRVRLECDPRVTDLLQHVKENLLGAYANQDIPFDQVVEAVQPARSLSHSPIFQVMFVLQNAPRGVLQLPGLRLTEQDVPLQTAQFDLSLSLQESADGLCGALNYASDLFDSATVQRWTGYFGSVLNSMVRQPHLPVSRLPLMDEEERRRVVELFNATQAPYPREKLIHELFEEQVQRTPNATAVVYEGDSLSYAELNGRANQLARYLKGQGVQIGEYVPILVSRSSQMLIAQLAVLKCGAVYVPMDAELPAERKAFMIRDCGARRVLADREQLIDFAAGQVEWIDCVGLADVIGRRSARDLRLPLSPAPPAYVMYTSGSTGVPKGVIVPHHAVNRLAINNGYAQINPQDCLVHYSNPAFDASTLEVWGALLNGARVVVVPQSVVLEAQRFAELLEQRQVTVLYMSVGLFNQYTQALAHVFAKLRYLLVGGDSLEPSAIRRVLHNSPPQHLLNAYGPTECTTLSTTHLIEAVEEGARSIPIGRPLANGQIYILDSHRQPVPIGVTGELYVGGEGVACGYLNRPELTAERFLPDPFSRDPRARMYRTGDLGRWRADGAVEFLGRNDHQVKIRGFRIEPGEIEAQLIGHAQVKEAVVIARGDVPGEKRLVAYVVPDGGPDAAVPSADALRTHLKAVLPDYMVPSAFVMLVRMPLTQNGKIDRRALPAPQLGAYASRQYEPAHGEMEEALSRIWQELLRVERVGRADNFFELGGHSLLAMQMVARIQTSLSIEVPIRLLFEFPTLSQFSAQVQARRHDRMLDRIAEGGAEVDELLERVAAMPENKVEELLVELTAGGRP